MAPRLVVDHCAWAHPLSADVHLMHALGQGSVQLVQVSPLIDLHEPITGSEPGWWAAEKNTMNEFGLHQPVMSCRSASCRSGGRRVCALVLVSLRSAVLS